VTLAPALQVQVCVKRNTPGSTHAKRAAHFTFYGADLRMTDKPKFGFIHYAVVFSDGLERVPAWLVLAALAMLVTHAAWLCNVMTGVGLAALLAIDWVMLAWLPKRSRSFGPVTASLLALSIVRWALVMAAASAQVTWITATIIVVQPVITSAAWYGLWIEPFRLGVTRVQIKSPKLNGHKPLRLLHLSDLHIERITRREQKLLRLVDELRPDLIVFTGDYLNLSYTHDERAHADCREVLAQLHAPMGVYAISGSVSVDPQPVVTKLLDGLSVQRLDNQVHAIKIAGDEPSLAVIGVTCTNNAPRDSETLRQVMGQVPNNPCTPFTLLLYHTPDIIPQAARQGVDLYLCGHTHGGQVRLPLFGALVTSSRFWKRYEIGRYVESSTTLYVSRGIGLEGKGAPRVRFLCSPEIELFELHGSDE
jgi:predicted MPP superfamily phosphohydrolase